MIDALIAGRLIGQPAARTARNGSPFATAKIRAADNKGEPVIVSVISFSRSAVAALLALGDGDSVALAGELSISGYTGKDGTTRPSLDLQAHAVLTEYHVSRRRRAVAAAKPEPEPEPEPDTGSSSAAESPAAQPDFDDPLPF